MRTKSYQVTAPKTPGSEPATTRDLSLTEARKEARTYADRRDLAYQDVRIENNDGSLKEYAGPCR